MTNHVIHSTDESHVDDTMMLFDEDGHPIVSHKAEIFTVTVSRCECGLHEAIIGLGHRSIMAGSFMAINRYRLEQVIDMLNMALDQMPGPSHDPV